MTDFGNEPSGHESGPDWAEVYADEAAMDALVAALEAQVIALVAKIIERDEGATFLEGYVFRNDRLEGYAVRKSTQEEVAMLRKAGDNIIVPSDN